jgi:hypothetical protein
MVLRLSKKQKINKKRSKKNNVVKNQYGGTWDELFTREFGTAVEVGVQLGIRPHNGVSIIDPETYRLICNRLRQARDRLNDIEHPELFPGYYRAIKFFINNVNLLFRSFATRQAALGLSRFYFHFNDGELYPDPIQYNEFDNLELVEHILLSLDTLDEQNAFRKTVDVSRVPNFAESRPQYNNIVVSSIFITTHLLDNISRILYTLNNNLQYHRAHNNLTPAQIQRITELITTTQEEYFTIIREIITSFLGIFTANLVNILTSTEPKDIAYISVLNTDVTHLYTLLVNLPQCAEVDALLNPIVVYLYLKRDLPQRFLFLKCISNNPVLFRLLADDGIYTYAFRCQDMITLLDSAQAVQGQETREREDLFFELIDNTVFRMQVKNSLRFDRIRPYYDLWPIEFAEGMVYFNERTNSSFSGLIPHHINIFIKTICNRIDVLQNDIKVIPPQILEHTENIQQQHIDNTNTKLLLFLFFLRVIIYNNKHLLDTFLVCLLTNTINSIVINMRVNTNLRNLAYNIIALCYPNRNFMNYLATELDVLDIPHYVGINRLTNGNEIFLCINRDFHNLIVISDTQNLGDFICPFRDTFIMKLGAITALPLTAPRPNVAYIDINGPTTGNELGMLETIDIFTFKRSVLLTGKNPYNNKDITLDEVDRLQLRYQTEIDALKAQKENHMPILQGCRVQIVGMVNAPIINGRTGIVTNRFNAVAGTWEVTIDSVDEEPLIVVNIPLSNLTMLQAFNYN